MKVSTLKRIFWVSCWAVLAFFSQFVDAESNCPSGIPQTAEEARFEISNSGEALHLAHNLVFMRCSLGQTWNGSLCIGEAKVYNWQEALEASRAFSLNDSRNWRLPNVKELSVISEKACVRPAIDELVFPRTSPDDYWTSTPSMTDQERAWAVSFENGSISLKAKDRDVFVRLVRTKITGE